MWMRGKHLRASHDINMAAFQLAVAVTVMDNGRGGWFMLCMMGTQVLESV